MAKPLAIGLEQWIDAMLHPFYVVTILALCWKADALSLSLCGHSSSINEGTASIDFLLFRGSDSSSQGRLALTRTYWLLQ